MVEAEAGSDDEREVPRFRSRGEWVRRAHGTHLVGRHAVGRAMEHSRVVAEAFAHDQDEPADGDYSVVEAARHRGTF